MKDERIKLRDLHTYRTHSCQGLTSVVRWDGPDVWQLTGVRLMSGLVRIVFLFFLWWESIFWGEKWKTVFFPLKTGPLGGSGGTVYTYRTSLVGFTVKTKTTDIQTVDSDYSKTIHQEMEEDHKTKEVHDEGIQKHLCQIEWRGAHLKFVYYNGKQVLCAYNMLHVTTVLHVKSEDELADTYTYILRWYMRTYIHKSISVGLDAQCWRQNQCHHHLNLPNLSRLCVGPVHWCVSASLMRLSAVCIAT